MKSVHNLLYKYTEKGSVFKDYLVSNGLEKTVVEIKPFMTPLDLVAVRYKKCYHFIDKAIYNEVKRLLNEAGLKKEINNIAFILKRYYYQQIIDLINKPFVDSFIAAIKDLEKILETPVQSIVIQGAKTTEKVKLNDALIIDIILYSYNEFMRKSTAIRDIIAGDN